MALLILSFLAGILTVASPCVLTLLPVIVGGSIARSDKKQWYRPLIIALSLAASVIIFTLLLKASTALLGVPQMFWQIVSGVIVTGLGVHFLKPELWERIPYMNKLNIGSNQLLGKSYSQGGLKGDVLIGASLGPVFTSCSPTYALVVASVLPVSFGQGLVYLLAYAVGLAGALMIVGYLGQAAVMRMGWLSNPNGAVRKIIGIVFILVGLMVIAGLDKKFQAFVLDQGWYEPIVRVERLLKP